MKSFCAMCAEVATLPIQAAMEPPALSLVTSPAATDAVDAEREPLSVMELLQLVVNGTVCDSQGHCSSAKHVR
jgi:hypothetical protein